MAIGKIAKLVACHDDLGFTAAGGPRVLHIPAFIMVAAVLNDALVVRLRDRLPKHVGILVVVGKIRNRKAHGNNVHVSADRPVYSLFKSE
jgi:hypothetical protein